LRTIQHIIQAERRQILERWAAQARTAASARNLSFPELMNIMPSYLDSLASAEGDINRQVELVEHHLASRIRHGFDLPELQREFTLIGRSILQTWAAVPPEERPDVGEMDNVLEVVHESAVKISDMFVRYLLEEAQSEKRYFRLIRQAFSEPPSRSDSAPALPERLRAALSVVMEALQASTAAILLQDPETQGLVMAASAGLAEESLTPHARSLATSSLSGLIASRDETTTVLDAETAVLEMSDKLRHSGIRALLGVRVPLHGSLLGVMYVGMRESRPFAAREKRRIEAIAEHLGLLIENAKLNLGLEQQIESLKAERSAREGFASVLAHDIRGPIAAARVAAQMLHRTGDASKLPHWTDMILRSLDRATRMVSDLLDAQRVQAGQPLQVSREPCDLAAIVRDVVEELSVEHGDRFLIVAPEAPVVGSWGREELRRAIWNLSTNAIKHGFPSSPVRITVRDFPRCAEVEVHNQGPPISPDDQAKIFDPFTQARREDSKAPRGGWGLGLTVVRGVAVAHGGNVTVDSDAERGTSFTMRIGRE